MIFFGKGEPFYWTIHLYGCKRRFIGEKEKKIWDSEMHFRKVQVREEKGQLIFSFGL